MLAHGQYPHRARLKAGAGRSYESPRFQNVLHVVRCPMQHISSFTAHLNSSYDFIRSHLLAQIDSANCSQPLSTSSTQLRSSESALEANVSCDDYEDSIWHSRNYKSFFSRRRGIILESGKNCPRGERCWLYFAALSWLFWTSHIQRYFEKFASAILIIHVVHAVERFNLLPI